MNVKLDRGLRAALRAFEETRAAREPEAAMAITLRYEGDLAAIEALGFGTTEVVSDTEARGVVRFAGLAALAEHPGVLWMSAGREWRKDVHWALPDARVRASSAANVGKDGLWFLPDSGNTLTSVANGTGKGVIVAIIDGGIDFKHPMFLSQLTPPKKTRIRRIWDQGLKGKASEGPAVAKLFSQETYGVEFNTKQIEDALNGVAPIAHKDCDGHGTHVAGIAAGGQLSPGFPRRAGVAPEADLIVVKMLGVVTPIKYRKANDTEGNDVAPEDRFKDAVLWCLNTAKELNAPVVINMSIGSELDPGDALDRDAVWVDGLFGASPVQPGAPHFPNRAILVKGAGNYARMGARVQFTQNNQAIIVKLKLIDTRGGLLTTWMHCDDHPYKPDVSVTFWYRRNFDNVKFALQLPNEASFGNDLGVGQSDLRTFVVHAGPPQSISNVPPSSADVHRVSLVHNNEGPVTHPNGTSIHRHSVDLTVSPKDSGHTIAYHTGEYQVRITAPKGTEVFLMCEGEGWAFGKYVFFDVVSGAASDPEFTLTSPLGKNVITVSAYDHAYGAAGHPHFHRIAPFSSRGPLRNFADPNLPNPPGVVAEKPDIAAPGVKVSSAQSIDSIRPFLQLPDWIGGERFIEYSGTSTAAPIVAGIVALLLAKKPDLTVGQVRTLLNAGARPGADPAQQPGSEAHKRAYGAGMVGALESHKKIP